MIKHLGPKVVYISTGLRLQGGPNYKQIASERASNSERAEVGSLAHSDWL